MSILVLFFNFCLDECIPNVTCCNISVPSIIVVIIIDSVIIVGLETCSRSIHWRCGFPLAKCLPLINPSFFSVRKICDSSTWYLSVVLMVFQSICMKQSLSWSFFISFIAACFAASPNLAMPCLWLYVITCWSKWFIAVMQHYCS